MSTSFTIWHYASFIIISAILTVAIIFTQKQKEITQKGSFIAVYSIAALILLLSAIMGINTFTKQVLLMNVKNHRFLSTESIIYTGTVRNTGNYDVGQVEIEIEIFDKGLKAQKGASYQSSAFKDHYNDVDIGKFFGFNKAEEKPTSLTIRKTVAKELKARQSKQFAVSIRYPSHFSGYISKERVIVH
jgi:hypothetical protein